MFKRHHIFTLATSNNNIPWCCTCFYVYDEKQNRLLFTSENDTRHISETTGQPFVAGTIALETKLIGKIQGLQFSGVISELSDIEYDKALKKYLRKFPYVAPFIKNTPIFEISLKHIKMTDNRLGFGKKVIWNHTLPE